MAGAATLVRESLLARSPKSLVVAQPHILPATIQQAILNCLGEMVDVYRLGLFEISDGSRNAAHFVVCSGAQTQLVHRLAQQLTTGLVQRR